MDIHIQTLIGNWREGFALDLHTTKSFFFPERGPYDCWETIRPEIAQALYELKYKGDHSKTEPIVNEICNFYRNNCQHWKIDIILPVPPSAIRQFQPVIKIAKLISEKLDIPLDNNVLVKTKSTSQLKSIEEPDKRKQILNGAFDVKLTTLENKNVLLFDDLFRSGETLNEITRIIYSKGKAKNVYVLTVTKTRSKR